MTSSYATAATASITGSIYRRALKAKKPEQRPLFSRFTEIGVVWSDSAEEQIDAVIFATGYRPSYPYLADLGALNENGTPRHRQGVSTVVPGLYFVGMSGQRSFRSATLRGVGADAAFVVERLRRHVATTSSAASARSDDWPPLLTLEDASMPFASVSRGWSVSSDLYRLTNGIRRNAPQAILSTVLKNQRDRIR